MTESAKIPETYLEMFEEYLAESEWARDLAHKLVVFHVRKLCRQLDDGGIDKAAMSGAYLNAVKELEKRRPGARPPVPGDLPGQGSIFDELGD